MLPADDKTPAADRKATAVKAKPPADVKTTYEPWRFVSIPDFVNNDVAYPEPRWDDALDFVLSEIKKEDPDFVVVAGDLVMGRWSHSEHHLQTMASVYYPAWIARMNAHALKFYTAVGDHELGDNPWDAKKTELAPLYEEAFRTYLKMPANGPADLKGLAYYVVHKNLVMIVVDVFETSDVGVAPGVSGDQLVWVEETLQAQSRAEHTVVVGHIPILPTRRSRTSSRLHLPGEGDSPLWKLLTDHEVDLYLCGEMHDISIRRKGDVHQVAHGVNPAAVNEFNYLVVTVYQDSLELEIKQVATIIDGSKDLSLDPYGEDPYRGRTIRIPDEYKHSGMKSLGSMVIKKSEGSKIFRYDPGVFLDRLRYSE